MEGKKRREELMKILANSDAAVSGSKLASKLGVSRQVIVQDIALLRAVNKHILPTARGYILYQQLFHVVERRFHVWHTTEQIEDELCTIVDLGGKVKNVMVTHAVYGEISAELILSNRQDVREFCQKIKEYQGIPLKDLSDGTHWHFVTADTEGILDRIEQELKKKGYLCRSEADKAEV